MVAPGRILVSDLPSLLADPPVILPAAPPGDAGTTAELSVLIYLVNLSPQPRVKRTLSQQLSPWRSTAPGYATSAVPAEPGQGEWTAVLKGGIWLKCPLDVLVAQPLAPIVHSHAPLSCVDRIFWKHREWVYPGLRMIPRGRH